MFDKQTLATELIVHSPLSFEQAVKAFGSEPNLNNDADRAGFFAVWALLRVELAEATLTAIRDKRNERNKAELEAANKEREARETRIIERAAEIKAASDARKPRRKVKA